MKTNMIPEVIHAKLSTKKIHRNQRTFIFEVFANFKPFSVIVGQWEEAVGLQDKIVEQLGKALVDMTDMGVKENLEQQIVFHSKQKQGIIQSRKRCKKIKKELVN